MFRFESPYAFLLLLIPLAVLAWRRWRRVRQTAALTYSSVSGIQRVGRSFRQRTAWAPTALRTISVILLVVALARPQTGRERVEEASQGVAIEMVLDRSGSMQLEMEFEGTMRERLEAAKEVFRRFVFGHGKQLQGRRSDLVGMIAFARHADTVCPLTLAHGVLRPFLDTVQTAATREEDGTAIGDAVALAAARLHTVEETLALQTRKGKDTYDIRSKVMILLTDGENNCGRRTVRQAGELAAQWGIRIYVVLVGGGEAYQVIQTPFGKQRRRVMTQEVDSRDLRHIAETTGGFFRQAQDARTLESVYAEIDQMERSSVETLRFTDYREMYLPFALTAFVLLLLEILLRCTLYRRLP
ncbi:MAG: VWA domain-containing protein [Victivallales bacterium]|nr:VWA domain-containing protein [Victivallales bacterium]